VIQQTAADKSNWLVKTLLSSKDYVGISHIGTFTWPNSGYWSKEAWNTSIKEITEPLIGESCQPTGANHQVEVNR